MGGSPAETVQSRVTNEPSSMHTLQPGKIVAPDSTNTVPPGFPVLQLGITGTSPGVIKLHCDSVEVNNSHQHNSYYATYKSS